MQNKINLQDNFLTRARRGKLNVTVFLMNGYQLRGVWLYRTCTLGSFASCSRNQFFSTWAS